MDSGLCNSLFTSMKFNTKLEAGACPTSDHVQMLVRIVFAVFAGGQWMIGGLCPYIYICILYIYIYVCIYIYTYIHTYIHTYKHIYIYTHTHVILFFLGFDAYVCSSGCSMVHRSIITWTIRRQFDVQCPDCQTPRGQQNMRSRTSASLPFEVFSFV